MVEWRRCQVNPEGEMKGCPSVHMEDNRCLESKDGHIQKKKNEVPGFVV